MDPQERLLSAETVPVDVYLKPRSGELVRWDDAGAVLLWLRRPWPAVTTLALVGTQSLFWFWYHANYHPEKLGAALAFQAAVFFLFLAQGLAAAALRPGPASGEDLGRWVLNATFGFLGAYVLLDPDQHAWMGTLALTLAAFYAALAWRLLAARRDDARLFLTTLAVAVVSRRGIGARCTSTPSGTAIANPISTGTNDSRRWITVSAQASSRWVSR